MCELSGEAGVGVRGGAVGGGEAPESTPTPLGSVLLFPFSIPVKIQVSGETGRGDSNRIFSAVLP